MCGMCVKAIPPWSYIALNACINSRKGKRTQTKHFA